MDMGGELHTPVALPPVKYWVVGRVCPRASLGLLLQNLKIYNTQIPMNTQHY